MMTRDEIREYANTKGVKFVEVAYELDISKQKLNKILSSQLTEVSVSIIVKAIDQIAEKKIEEGKLG